MSDGFDGNVTNLMASTVSEALDRLRKLGLVDGDAGAEGTALTKLIVEAIQRGETEHEKLILYAMGRFQVGRPIEGS